MTICWGRDVVKMKKKIRVEHKKTLMYEIKSGKMS